MSEPELVPWLRPKIKGDLKDWRDRKAHFRRVREREGDYHYFEARERVAQLEAELAILDEHRSDTAMHGVEMPDGAWAPQGLVCLRCGFDDGRLSVPFPCRTVRLIGYGYRFRPGYRKEWKP